MEMATDLRPMEMATDFRPTEHPSWRKSGISTSTMAKEIFQYCIRYRRLSQEQKLWCREVYMPRAYSEYLHQVNKIEGEGFDTYPKTCEAISNGALVLSDRPHENPRLESLCGLYRALGHFFKLNGDRAPPISISELEKCHWLLLGWGQQREIAGRFRSQENEVVSVNTKEGCVRLFMWPTQVRPALMKLFEKTKADLRHIGTTMNEEKVLELLKLGSAFFLEFESIHPFLDGDGRCGRVLLAYILQNIMPFPNVFFVDGASDDDLPPFIGLDDYHDCFKAVQAKQHFEVDSGRPVFTEDDYPRDLTALIIEGVYVSWKRFFEQLEQEEHLETGGHRDKKLKEAGVHKLKGFYKQVVIGHCFFGLEDKIRNWIPY